MVLDHLQHRTVFVGATQNASPGMTAVWKFETVWKMKAASLGRYLTRLEAASFESRLIRIRLIAYISSQGVNHVGLQRTELLGQQ
jgi:hypothetical protein